MDYDTYEDLQGLWSDLEAALALVLTHPAQVSDVPQKVLQLDAWLQELMAHDSDSGLYLMYQLAAGTTVGYSAAHALVCATLSHLLAQSYRLPQVERDALVRAALTMNIGMTQLQNQLALQRERPSAAQQEAIRVHAVEGRRLLERMKVTDKLWLDVVTLHHIHVEPTLPLLDQPPAERLARLLATVDRYAAMISPRRTRVGRTVAESIQIVTGPRSKLYEKAGEALKHCVGYYPPGVFVALSDGTTAVVLRRSSIPGKPQVAKLLDARQYPLAQPEIIMLTNQEVLHITHSLPAAEVRTKVDARSLMRLGALMTGSTPKLRQVTHTPGQR
jgi:hypothetical protein